MRRVLSATIVGGCAALAAAGCGTAHAAAPPGAIPRSPAVSISASPAAKPVTERVPSTARVVTITSIPGLGSRGRLPEPVTLAGAAAVRRIAALVDALPVFPPGAYNCPMDTGKGLRLTFRATSGGPAVATATAGLDGCGGVSLTVAGGPRPGLSGGPEFAAQVLAIAGLHWPGYMTHD
jgi:hypothetical protein